MFFTLQKSDTVPDNGNKTVRIATPAPGEALHLTFTQGTNYLFSFDPESASASRTGNDLVFRVQNEGTITIEEYFASADAVTPGGGFSTANLLVPVNAGAWSSGGSFEYADNPGSLVEGVDLLGAQDDFALNNEDADAANDEPLPFGNFTPTYSINSNRSESTSGKKAFSGRDSDDDDSGGSGGEEGGSGGSGGEEGGSGGSGGEEGGSGGSGGEEGGGGGSGGEEGGSGGSGGEEGGSGGSGGEEGGGGGSGGEEGGGGGSGGEEGGSGGSGGEEGGSGGSGGEEGGGGGSGGEEGGGGGSGGEEGGSGGSGGEEGGGGGSGGEEGGSGGSGGEEGGGGGSGGEEGGSGGSGGEEGGGGGSGGEEGGGGGSGGEEGGGGGSGGEEGGSGGSGGEEGGGGGSGGEEGGGGGSGGEEGGSGGSGGEEGGSGGSGGEEGGGGGSGGEEGGSGGSGGEEGGGGGSGGEEGGGGGSGGEEGGGGGSGGEEGGGGGSGGSGGEEGGGGGSGGEEGGGGGLNVTIITAGPTGTGEQTLLGDWANLTVGNNIINSGTTWTASDPPSSAANIGIGEVYQDYLFEVVQAQPGKTLSLSSYGYTPGSTFYGTTKLESPVLIPGANSTLLYLKDCGQFDPEGGYAYDTAYMQYAFGITLAETSDPIAAIDHILADIVGIEPYADNKGNESFVSYEGDYDWNLVSTTVTSAGGEISFAWSFKGGNASYGNDAAFWFLLDVETGEVIAGGVLSQGATAASGVTTIELPVLSEEHEYVLTIGQMNIGAVSTLDQAGTNPHMLLGSIVQTEALFSGDLLPEEGALLTSFTWNDTTYVFPEGDPDAEYRFEDDYGALVVHADGVYYYVATSGEDPGVDFQIEAGYTADGEQFILILDADAPAGSVLILDSAYSLEANAFLLDSDDALLLSVAQDTQDSSSDNDADPWATGNDSQDGQDSGENEEGDGSGLSLTSVATSWNLAGGEEDEADGNGSASGGVGSVLAVDLGNVLDNETEDMDVYLPASPESQDQGQSLLAAPPAQTAGMEGAASVTTPDASDADAVLQYQITQLTS